MTDLDFTPPSPRPLWLVTLADLALLLVGFFVLVQVTRAEPRALAGGLRAGFTAEGATALPVAANILAGFAPGSAALPANSAALTAWARQVLGDPRVMLKVAGGVDGSAADVDAATGSGPLLAADRARAVAALLAPLAPARVLPAIAAGPQAGRAVIVTLAFAGEPPRTRP